MGDVEKRHLRSVSPKFPVRQPNFQPIIGVDLDNVCFHHTRGLRPFAAAWLAEHKNPEITVDDLVEDAGWFAPEWEITPDEFFEIERYAIERGLFRDAEPIDGAVRALKKLVEDGYRIRYVTARPQHLDAAQQTRDSLRAHRFPNPDEVLFVGEHFGSHLKSMLNYALYIDDSVSNIRDFQSTGIPYIVFDQVYNQDLGSEQRVYSWTQVREIVTDLLGLPEVPVDRSIELREVEEACLILGKRIEELTERLTTLTEERQTRGHTKRWLAAKDKEIAETEAELTRVSQNLNRREAQRSTLERQVRRYIQFVNEHPDWVPDDGRKHARAGERLAHELADVLKIRTQLEQREAAIRAREVDCDVREAGIEEQEAALAHKLQALGLLPEGTEPDLVGSGGNGKDSANTVSISYGDYAKDLYDNGRDLDRIAMRTARLHIENAGFKVIGERVVVRFGKEMSDIDILAMRVDDHGLSLAQQRAELIASMAEIGPKKSAATALEREIRRIEQELYLAVEVKWFRANLSAAQRSLHQRLLAGGAAETIAELPDGGRFSRIAQADSFGATPLTIRVLPPREKSFDDIARMNDEIADRLERLAARANPGADHNVVALKPGDPTPAIELTRRFEPADGTTAN